MEIAMMIVDRQLPRNKRIMMLVRTAAITPSRTTPAIAPANEYRLVADETDLQIVRKRVLEN